jgi:hypothetical protein
MTEPRIGSSLSSNRDRDSVRCLAVCALALLAVTMLGPAVAADPSEIPGPGVKLFLQTVGTTPQTLTDAERSKLEHAGFGATPWTPHLALKTAPWTPARRQAASLLPRRKASPIITIASGPREASRAEIAGKRAQPAAAPPAPARP